MKLLSYLAGNLCAFALLIVPCTLYSENQETFEAAPIATHSAIAAQPLNLINNHSIKLLAGEAPACFVDSMGKEQYLIANYDRVAGIAQDLITDKQFLNPLNHSAAISDEILNLFRAHKYSHKKYNPEALPAKMLKKTLVGSDYKYEGTPIVDEINKGYSIRVNLNTELEVHNLISYLREHEAALRCGSDKKPVFYLYSHSIDMLSPSEKNFLSKYVTCDSSEATRAFFIDSQKQKDELKVESEEYKTILESLYNLNMKDFKDFKKTKIAVAFLRDAIPGIAKWMAYGVVSTYIFTKFKEKPDSKTYNKYIPYINNYMDSVNNYTKEKIWAKGK